MTYTYKNPTTKPMVIKEDGYEIRLESGQQAKAHKTKLGKLTGLCLQYSSCEIVEL